MVIKTAMGLLPADQLMWCKCICEGLSERVNGQMNDQRVRLNVWWSLKK